jgi:hypothetical protein
VCRNISVLNVVCDWRHGLARWCILVGVLFTGQLLPSQGTIWRLRDIHHLFYLRHGRVVGREQTAWWVAIGRRCAPSRRLWSRTYERLCAPSLAIALLVQAVIRRQNGADALRRHAKLRTNASRFNR